MQLSEGRIPMNSAEEATLDHLLEEHADLGAATLSRRDPGESGPLLVQIGDLVFEIDGTDVRHVG